MTRLDRDAALAARPVRLPELRREEKEGKLYVTVRLERPRWQRWLGAEATCERTFGLDAYGREVLEMCTGDRTVNTLIERFARNHRLSIPEAEASVTTFLQTLMRKGLVGMAVARSSI